MGPPTFNDIPNHVLQKHVLDKLTTPDVNAVAMVSTKARDATAHPHVQEQALKHWSHEHAPIWRFRDAPITQFRKSQILSRRAQVLEEQGRHVEALAILEELRVIDKIIYGTKATAIYDDLINRARVLRKLGKEKEALVLQFEVEHLSWE